VSKILIMDDEPGLLNVVFNILKPTGHTLFLAEDGTRAIEIGKKEKPDLALLDIRVPDYDGLEVLAELKKMDPNIKGIMLSGFGDVESAVGAMKQGAADYISKPFKIEEVLKVVSKALAEKPAPILSSSGQGTKPESMLTVSPSVRTVEIPKTYAPPKFKYKIWAFAGIGVVAVALIGFSIWKFSISTSLKPTGFSIPYSNPSAITWDGQNLWVADWASQSIYKHRSDKTLSIDSVFTLVDIHPTGLVWDGDHLWSCSTMEKKITKHAPDATLTSLITFPNPLQEPTALAWDGLHLWCADGAGGKLYKLKPVGEGLNIAGVYDGAATNPVGMFFYQNHLWVADGERGKIYEQDPNTLAVLGIYSLEPYSSRMEQLAGMTFDGEHIWSAARKSSKIYRHKFSSLKKINP